MFLLCSIKPVGGGAGCASTGMSGAVLTSKGGMCAGNAAWWSDRTRLMMHSQREYRDCCAECDIAYAHYIYIVEVGVNEEETELCRGDKHREPAIPSWFADYKPASEPGQTASEGLSEPYQRLWNP